MTNVAFRFDERTVAVTGAATGIGKATALAFARAGAKVWLLDVDEAGGLAAADEVEGAQFLHCDVTSTESIDAAFTQVGADGGLDVVVNNAGGFWQQQVTETLPVEEWERVVELNLNAVFLVARRAVPLLRRSPAGRVVNIGSLAGLVAGYRTSPAYAAAKAGVHSFTRVLATELAGDRITVNALAPSAVMTERIVQLRDEAEREATARSIPLGRYQTPDEVAAWVLFLASDEAGFLTGQTISVNGGRHMV
jgi:NAD(P)-dependent dehydrogenase (short-subunit alcohol dehydrogenase family)